MVASTQRRLNGGTSTCRATARNQHGKGRKSASNFVAAARPMPRHPFVTKNQASMRATLRGGHGTCAIPATVHDDCSIGFNVTKGAPGLRQRGNLRHPGEPVYLKARRDGPQGRRGPKIGTSPPPSARSRADGNDYSYTTVLAGNTQPARSTVGAKRRHRHGGTNPRLAARRFAARAYLRRHGKIERAGR